MGRWVPVLLAMGGCLWIGPEEHDQRKTDLQIEFELVTLNPESWSTCAGTPTFAVAANVAGRHAGAAFEAWYQFDNGVRYTVGDVIAGSQLQGVATVTFELTPDPAVTVFDDCVDECTTELTIGLARLGGEDFGAKTVTIVGDANPMLVGGALSGPGGMEPLSALESLIQPNPADSINTVTYPILAVVVDDPVVQAGLGANVSVAACPVGVDPVAGVAQCIVVAAEPSELELTEGSGLQVSTVGFGEAGCADPTQLWDFYALVTDHPCGGPYPLSISATPFRFVHDDCDGDGFTVAGGDCVDDDPLINPETEEIWYDDLDQNCDGADDFDQDGDGERSEQHGGFDCDDTNDTVYPGAEEVCDDADNDCDGVTLVDQVTVFTSVGPPIVETDLQRGIDLAATGDLIQICPGTFDGNFVVDKSVDIIGSGSQETILRSVGNNQSVLQLTNNVDIVLEGVQLTGAAVTGTLAGGGLDAANVNTLTATDLLIVGNDATSGGGATLGGTVTLIDSTIDSNSAQTLGGGLDLLSKADLTLTNTVVQSNSTAGSGGGIAVDDGLITMDATSAIRQNTAGVSGGGIYTLDDLDLTGGVIEENGALSGGGIALAQPTENQPMVTIDGTIIRNHSFGITRGGGIFMEWSYPELILMNAEVSGNVATQEGGGIYAYAQDDTLLVWTEDSIISGNDAGTSGGGAFVRNGLMWAFGGSYDTNTAGADGGGIYMRDSYWSILATTVQDNVASFNGGGFYARDVQFLWNFYSMYYGPLDIMGNGANNGGGGYVDNSSVVNQDMTVTNNTAVNQGGGFFVTGTGGHVGSWGSGSVTGNSSAGNASDGAYRDQGSVQSCPTITFTDTVAEFGTNFGVPSDPCFFWDDNSLDIGECTGCP